jgi:hypothetical protein
MRPAGSCRTCRTYRLHSEAAPTAARTVGQLGHGVALGRVGMRRLPMHCGCGTQIRPACLTASISKRAGSCGSTRRCRRPTMRSTGCSGLSTGVSIACWPGVACWTISKRGAPLIRRGKRRPCWAALPPPRCTDDGRLASDDSAEATGRSAGAPAFSTGAGSGCQRRVGPRRRIVGGRVSGFPSGR